VIHIVLDELQTDVFEGILDAHARSSLDGFVLYRDTLGPFPTTHFEIPALLSGQRFQSTPTLTLEEVWSSLLGGETLPSVLADHGYENGSGRPAALRVLPSGAARPRRVDDPGPVRHHSAKSTRAQNAEKVVAATRFRYAPMVLKPLLYGGPASTGLRRRDSRSSSGCGTSRTGSSSATSRGAPRLPREVPSTSSCTW